MDLIRPTNPRSLQLDSDACQVDGDGAKQPKEEAGSAEGEVRDSDTGAGVRRPPGHKHEARWLQPLFVSCTCTNYSITSGSGALQRALSMAGPAMLGIDRFPCALSTHMFGGAPLSVLSAAAAASGLLESLDMSHFEASRSQHGRVRNGQHALEDAAYEGDLLLRSVAAIEPQRFGFILPMGPDRQEMCAGREHGGSGEAQGPLPSTTEGNLPWDFVYQSTRKKVQDGAEVLGWERKDVAQAQGTVLSVLGDELGSALLDVGRALGDVQEVVEQILGEEHLVVEEDEVNQLTIFGYPGRLGNWLFRVAAGLGVVREREGGMTGTWRVVVVGSRRGGARKAQTG